jgi:hypothetical protein
MSDHNHRGKWGVGMPYSQPNAGDLRHSDGPSVASWTVFAFMWVSARCLSAISCTILVKLRDHPLMARDSGPQLATDGGEDLEAR